MYSWPTRLPATTNREDLTFTTSIFDDDTGLPVNLTGVVNLSNPNGLTINNWTVTDGSINTTSTTSFFVPGFPTTNQLLSPTFTVGLNLGILPGDPITIASVATTDTLIGFVLAYTASTGALTVQIGYNFQAEIRGYDRHRWYDDYSPWYDWGGSNFASGIGGNQPRILITLGQGLTIVDVGFILLNVPVSMLQQLSGRTYMIAMAMTDSVNTRSIFLAELPILYGGMQTWPWSNTFQALQNANLNTV